MKRNIDARNAFLSVIIGDGYIGKNGDACILHCEKQKDYLEWKREYLIKNGVKCHDIKYSNNGGYPAYKFSIATTRYSKLYRMILYKDGYKNIYNRKLLDRLSDIHIAIWYMDDGGLSQKKRDGVVVANDLMLNTHTSKENNQVIIDYFREVWNISFSQVKNKGWYRLRCGTKEARKFLKIVEKYVSNIPSMKHKLNIKA